jgi:hypothetical protein
MEEKQPAQATLPIEDSNEKEMSARVDASVKLEDQTSVKGRDTEDWRTLRQCAQVLSLCRVRDAMGTGMQPMMGYLRYVIPSLYNPC